MGMAKNHLYKKDLRRRAENMIHKKPIAFKKVAPDEVQRLIEELQIHQIELEMQNEELQRTQLDVEVTRDKYTDLYDFAPIGYFTLDGKGMMREANLTGASLLKMERGRLIGVPFTRFILSEDQDIFYHLRLNLLESESSQSCELRLVNKTGHAFHAQLHCTTRKENGDPQPRIRVAMIDITKRKQAEEQVLLYQQQLKSLTSGLTLAEEHLRNNLAMQLHDNICQSLAMLRVSVGMLSKSVNGQASQDRLKTMYDTIGDILDKANDLTSDLNYPGLHIYGFEKAVNKWATDELQVKYGIEVCIQNDGDAKPLNDDVMIVLFRGVRELLFNVIKHAQATRVHIEISRKAGKISVQLTDNGKGFDVAALSSKTMLGFGILSVMETLERLGGCLVYKSGISEGCSVEMTAPLTCTG